MTLARLDPEMPGVGILATLGEVGDMAEDLSMIAIAIVHKDMTIETVWSLPHNPAALLGAISSLAHDLHKELDNE